MRVKHSEPLRGLKKEGMWEFGREPGAQEGFPDVSAVKNSPANAGDLGSVCELKIPWGRKWQPTPVFLPGKSRGQRSLAGYSSWGHKRVRHDLATEHRYTVNSQET